MTATVGLTNVAVTGKGVFTAAGSEVATDPNTDGLLPGTELTGASITQFSQKEVHFTLNVADLGPTNGTPEGINFVWPLTVTKGTQTSEVELQAWRTSTAADATCGVVFLCEGQTPGGNPRFSVNTCSIDPQTGQNTCASVGVVGEFTATGLTWKVPTATINAAGGSELLADAPIAASVGASGLYWYNNGNGGDTMIWESVTLESATVQVGIAPLGTPPSQVPLTTSATVNNNSGNFTASLAKPATAGTYDVVAKACLGEASCGTAIRTVVIP